MDNVSTSISATDDGAAFIGAATVDGVLLLIVFINMAFNLIIVATLIRRNDGIVCSIRVILINILVACVIGGLASVIYHISSPILESGTSDTVHGLPLCQAFVFLHNASSSGRVLFAAYYGVTVFIVVRFWNKPVLAPRNTKYFILASVVLWVLAVAAGVSSIFDGTVNGFCGGSNGNMTTSQFTLPVTIPYFVVSAIPIIVTPVILIETSCYIKCKTIGEHRDTKKALVKFGLFLMIIQGFNALSQIVIPLLAIGIDRLGDTSLTFIVGVTLFDLSRIPTTALMFVFFKPVRVKLKRWLCCCYHCCKRAAMNGTTTNNTAITKA